MKLNEAQLYRAAALADAMELASLPDIENCPKHHFSDRFEKEMQELIGKVQRNEIKPYRISMGWQYYTKRGAAAILLCFLLACVTMPEVVIAGCQKLLDVVETVVTEYTEYQYHSHVPGDATFTPLELRYLPEGMKQVDRYEDEAELYMLYRDGNDYFTLNQILITENNSFHYIADTENAHIETKILLGHDLNLIYNDDLIIYVWQYDKYHIAGRSNLSAEELEKILNNLTIK